MDTARNPARPPGTMPMFAASCWEKPDRVSAQAIAVAVPIISRMTPASDAVPTRIGRSHRHG
jgi:hypothetical protein